MDMKTFEEKRVPKEDVQGARFMEEGAEVKLQIYDGKIIGEIYLFFMNSSNFSSFFMIVASACMFFYEFPSIG